MASLRGLTDISLDLTKMQRKRESHGSFNFQPHMTSRSEIRWAPKIGLGSGQKRLDEILQFHIPATDTVSHRMNASL